MNPLNDIIMTLIGQFQTEIRKHDSGLSITLPQDHSKQ